LAQGGRRHQVQHLREFASTATATRSAAVEQEAWPAHTGRRDCFFRAVRDGALVEIAAPLVDPARLYG